MEFSPNCRDLTKLRLMLTSIFIIPTLPWTFQNAKKEAEKNPKHYSNNFS